MEFKPPHCVIFGSQKGAKKNFWPNLDSNLGLAEIPQEDALDHWASQLDKHLGESLDI